MFNRDLFPTARTCPALAFWFVHQFNIKWEWWKPENIEREEVKK